MHVVESNECAHSLPITEPDLIGLAVHLLREQTRGNEMATRRLAVCLAIQTLDLADACGWPIWDCGAPTSPEAWAGRELWTLTRGLIVGRGAGSEAHAVGVVALAEMLTEAARARTTLELRR